ncbi:MAG: hypothetical protein ACJA2W_000296 [Planctomycetota bacterium]|jgi:hypothetical protein
MAVSRKWARGFDPSVWRAEGGNEEALNFPNERVIGTNP